MFRSKSKDNGAPDTATNPTATPPRIAFPSTKPRPISQVDAAGTDSALDISLSSSPSSAHSAIERLASAQRKDAAAAAASMPRTRTSSNTSRASSQFNGSEGSRSRVNSIPSLMKSATSLAPAVATTSTLTPASSAQEDVVSTSAASSRLKAKNSIKKKKKKAENATAAELLSQIGGPSTGAASPKKKATETSSTKAVVSSPSVPPLVAVLSDSSKSKLIKQGAEAKVYISHLLSESILAWPSSQATTVPAPAPILLKWRFPKTYRHPILSSSITASRTIMEARALLRCAKANVAVPGVRCVDEKEGILGLELISGKSVREWLGGGAEGEDERVSDEAQADQPEETLDEQDQVKLMHLIGLELAKMHEADIIHGDLTTSNMMLRSRGPSSNGKTSVDLDHDEVVLIDFGLSSVSAFPEDKAVDLYVLERAFASTHPASEGLFKKVLETYADEVTRRSSSRKGKTNRWEETRKRLEEVRLRGRKRSMVGPLSSAVSLVQANRNARFVFGFEVALSFELRGLGSGSGSGREVARGSWNHVKHQLDDQIGQSHLLGTPASIPTAEENDNASFLFAIIDRILPIHMIASSRTITIRHLPNTLQSAAETILDRGLQLARAFWHKRQHLKSD